MKIFAQGKALHKLLRRGQREDCHLENFRVRLGLQCTEIPRLHGFFNTGKRLYSEQSSCERAGRPAFRRSRSLIQASVPRVSVMSARSGGLQKASQRRGVTPLVLFWNFSGHRSAKSLKMVLRMMSLWMAATPLTVWLATTARYAILTDLHVHSTAVMDTHYTAGVQQSIACRSLWKTGAGPPKL